MSCCHRDRNVTQRIRGTVLPGLTIERIPVADELRELVENLHQIEVGPKMRLGCHSSQGLVFLQRWQPSGAQLLLLGNKFLYSGVTGIVGHRWQQSHALSQ